MKTNSDYTQEFLAKTNNTILVWSFQDAPQYYRELSPDGGDWLAWVPAELNIYLPWLDYFGAYEITQYEVESGQVYVGVHS